MIISFKHKGLKKLWTKNDASGMRADHVRRITMILQTMNAATRIEDLDIPSYRLHPLKGKSAGRWSVVVNGNWRITFKFENGNAEIIDYEDYH